MARGFQQKEGLDLTELFAPVVKLSTVRILLAVANHFLMYIHQMDVTNAFLHGEIQEEVYLRKPPGMEQDVKVLKLQKSLYGLKKSPKDWNSKLNTFMLDQKFKRSNADCCLYVKNANNQLIYLILYVDDILIFSCYLNFIEELEISLHKNFKMKNIENEINYLGLKITRNMEVGVLKIDQASYLNRSSKGFKWKIAGLQKF